MFLRHVALACACAALAGCDQIAAGFTPAEEKINAAFAPPDDLQSAHHALVSALEGDKAAQQAVAQQYGKLMEVRALTCTAKTPIGRFDTISTIRTKVTDVECFRKEDARLAEWISLQRLARVLAKPPLAPLAALPAKALLPNFNDYTNQVTVAASANVMIVKSAQRFNLVELPGGKQLNSFAVPEQNYRPAILSPNGRVLAIPVGSRNLRMVEVETGNVLWNTEEYSDLIAWLAPLDAALLTQTNSSSPQLLDVQKSTITPYPATEKRISWALSLPVAEGQYLVGSSQTASLMGIARGANGVLEAAPLKQWRLTGNGISSTPFLMNDRHKLVYPSSQDVGWLDMQTDQQGVWQLSALNASGFAKLGEQTILFDTMATGNASAATRVLDISQGSVAIAKNLDPRDGSLVSLAPRSGYLKRGNSAAIIGSAVELDTPQPLDALVSEANLARQLARLNALSAPADTAPKSEREQYIELLARQVRAGNAAGAIRDGLPRDVVESIRRGSTVASEAAVAAAEAARAAAGAAPSPFPGQKPMMADVPANAKVSFIGVYEADTSAQATPASGVRYAPPSPTNTPSPTIVLSPSSQPRVRSAGTIRVNVAPGSVPVVLVLSNYEPVHWVINAGNRKISAIFLSGYHPATISGQGSAQVLKIGSKYAYKIDSPDYTQLKQTLARYIPNPVQSFQGAYKGQDFSVY
jgi:hypothetical protein